MSLEHLIRPGKPSLPPGVERPILKPLMALLTVEQLAGLKNLSARSGDPMTRLVRQAVDRLLAEQAA